jgi:hypothetical protein
MRTSLQALRNLVEREAPHLLHVAEALAGHHLTTRPTNRRSSTLVRRNEDSLERPRERETVTR